MGKMLWGEARGMKNLKMKAKNENNKKITKYFSKNYNLSQDQLSRFLWP